MNLQEIADALAKHRQCGNTTAAARAALISEGYVLCTTYAEARRIAEVFAVPTMCLNDVKRLAGRKVPVVVDCRTAAEIAAAGADAVDQLIQTRRELAETASRLDKTRKHLDDAVYIAFKQSQQIREIKHNTWWREFCMTWQAIGMAYKENHG